MEKKSNVLEDHADAVVQCSWQNRLAVTKIGENGEDPDKVPQSFASEHLELDIGDTEIDRSHRLG